MIYLPILAVFILSWNTLVWAGPDEGNTPGSIRSTAVKPAPLRRLASGVDMMHHWNAIAIDASGLDHTPLRPGENRLTGEQLGPAAQAGQWPSSISLFSRR